jgi:hypothetical protein
MNAPLTVRAAGTGEQAGLCFVDEWRRPAEREPAIDLMDTTTEQSASAGILSRGREVVYDRRTAVPVEVV